MVAAPAGGRA